MQKNPINKYDYWDKILQTNVEYELIGAHKKEPHLHTDPHTHGNMCEIILNCNGTGTSWQSGTLYPVYPSSLIIHNKNAIHSEDLRPADGSKNIQLYYCAYTSFKISDFEDLQLIDEKDPPVIPVTKGLSDHMQYLFETSLSELENKDIGFSFIAHSCLTMVFLLTLRELIKNNLVPIALDSVSSNHAAKAKKMIDDSFTSVQFSISDVAYELKVSQSYLTKLFREHFNITPSDYLSEKRILKARKLLLTTNMSNEEISYAVGFSSPVNFYRTFKKYLDTSPNFFRSHTDIYTLFSDK